MKLHHILAFVLLPAIVVGLAIGLTVEHQARLNLAAEHQALEQQLQQMTDLTAKNAQLSNQLARESTPKPLPPEQLSELLRLRGQVGVLLRKKSGLDQARKENQQTHDLLDRYLKRVATTNDAATADYWPQGTWMNSGYDSPESALQTMLWAGYNGDVTNLFASVDVDARTNLDNEFKGKSAAETSIRIMDDMSDLKSMQILGRKALDDNTAVLTVEMENKDGIQTGGILMKRNGSEWKFAGGQEGQ